jgi:putative ABC transport system permease protein
MIAALVIFGCGVGVLAGSYPAFVLTKFEPARVLSGTLRKGMRGGRLRSILVVSQFAISTGLIIATLVVYRQLHYVQSRDLGFDKEQMFVVDNTWLLGGKTDSFRRALLGTPGIIDAAYTQNLPGNDISSGAYRREGDDKSNILMLRQLWCDFDFLPFLHVRLKEGRFFTREFMTDSTKAAIINERAARLLGYEHPVGRTLVGYFGQGERQLTIIGVTEDMHYEPLHQAILPMVTLVSHGAPTRIVLRLQGNLPEIVDNVQRQWMAFSGGHPFRAYFLSDKLEGYYREDQAIGMLFGIFAAIGVFISCLGLLGLATFATEQRTKEIGIRKILGASSPGLVGLLSREFIKLVLVANLLAWPVAYVAMQRWLENFAYRVTLGAEVFLTAGALALLVALFTVCYHTVRAAMANPVEALRYE